MVVTIIKIIVLIVLIVIGLFEEIYAPRVKNIETRAYKLGTGGRMKVSERLSLEIFPKVLNLPIQLWSVEVCIWL
jgi:hypothetical protein